MAARQERVLVIDFGSQVRELALVDQPGEQVVNAGLMR